MHGLCPLPTAQNTGILSSSFHATALKSQELPSAPERQRDRQGHKKVCNGVCLFLQGTSQVLATATSYILLCKFIRKKNKSSNLASLYSSTTHALFEFTISNNSTKGLEARERRFNQHGTVTYAVYRVKALQVFLKIPD